MKKTIPARFQGGMFKPLKPVKLPDNVRVTLIVTLAKDDLSSAGLARIAQQSRDYLFLNDSREDIYTLADGKAC